MSYVTGISGELKCDMVSGCTAPVTMLDEKGYVYCTQHGVERRTDHGKRCRKLRAVELKRLIAGHPLGSYECGPRR